MQLEYYGMPAMPGEMPTGWLDAAPAPGHWPALCPCYAARLHRVREWARTAAILAKVKKNVLRRPSWLAAAAKESRSGGGGTAGGVRPPADCRPACLARSSCRPLASHCCSLQSQQPRSAAVVATILATGGRNESESGRQQMLVGEF